ncbi:MAG: AMP-binding protein [Proteobacteria bacterium]|nr:AMP-binding protein [Pseudomonadota bacterium]
MNTQKQHNNKPWLNYYGINVPEKMRYEGLTIPGFLMQSVKAYPDLTALNFKGYKISYVQLLNMVNTLSCCLKKFGVKKGDCVGIILSNVIPSVVSYYATLKIGGVVVMIKPTCSDSEIEYQLNDSGVKVLVTLDILADRLIALRRKTKIQRVIYTSMGDYLPFPQNRLYPMISKKKGLGPCVSPARDLYTWKSIMAERPLIVGEESISLSDVAMVQYTGGASGVSNGVVLTHGNLSSQVQQMNTWFPDFIKGQEKFLGALPFYHMYGMTIAANWAMVNGWETILVAKPEPEILLKVIKQAKPGIAVFLPTMIMGMMNHPDFQKTDISSLKACFSGSAPLSGSVIKAFEEKSGAVVVEGYGLTEATAITHINPVSKKIRKLSSIGIPLPDTECMLIDTRAPEQDVPVGAPGELLIRGPQIMRGYLGKDEESKRVLANGWLRTGDVAYRDDDGFFYVVDRVRDMIISDGKNVYPREIDEVITQHPKVSEACAIGIPNEKKGEMVKLFVVLKKGETATPEEFIDFCKDKIDPYKWPSQVEIREALPKTHIGRILRQKLKDEELRRFTSSSQ